MAKVFLMVGTIPGKEKDVRDSLRKIKGTRDVDLVTGRHDVVAILEGKNLDDIFNSIFGKIRGIKGIARTETAVVVE